MALGSRYAPGGGGERAWSLRRILSSRLATALARPLSECTDPMSGFFAMDRHATATPVRPLRSK